MRVSARRQRRGWLRAIEAAILNLAINARDAMPHGRTRSVRTAKATLGREALADNREAVPVPFVALSVRDSGSGIMADVLTRAFELFFTTKGIGKGTGLGVSQVYGFTRLIGSRFDRQRRLMRHDSDDPSTDHRGDT